jgi:MFS transporter, DHA2 family, multidrug resistance protein
VSATAAAAPAGSAVRPWMGVLAVLCGAFISTVTGRLSTFGLNDIRGALGAGVDEGAWITTAQSCAQMLVGPVSVWLGTVFGPRRVLSVSAGAYAVVALLLPFAPGLPSFLALQFASGLATGTFIPLTIAYVLRSLPPRYWAYGIAAYALNLELSLNIAATLEGFYVERLSWHFIFWQGVPMALLMMGFIARGIPPLPIDWAAARRGDWFGMVSLSLGLALIYAALDQGNRLDWLGSGLVVGLLLGGGGLLVAFLVHETHTPTPWLDLRFVLRMPVPVLMGLVTLLRLAILSTALLLPQFLSVVQGYRALETGPALLALAVPQLAIAPAVGALLRRVDARLGMAAGLSLVAAACWMVASGLTRDWATADFLPSQALQAVGQTLAMSSIIFFGVLHLKPTDAMTFGAMLQTARLFGGELGSALIATFLRVREQASSYAIGLHVQSGGTAVLDRLEDYRDAVSGRGNEAARATGLLAQAIRTQANVQSFVDGFALVGVLVACGLVLVALMGPAPRGPASPGQ